MLGTSMAKVMKKTIRIRTMEKTQFNRRPGTARSFSTTMQPMVAVRTSQPTGPMAKAVRVGGGKTIACSANASANPDMTRKNITAQRRYAPPKIQEVVLIFIRDCRLKLRLSRAASGPRTNRSRQPRRLQTLVSWSPGHLACEVLAPRRCRARCRILRPRKCCRSKGRRQSNSDLNWKCPCLTNTGTAEQM